MAITEKNERHVCRLGERFQSLTMAFFDYKRIQMWFSACIHSSCMTRSKTLDLIHSNTKSKSCKNMQEQTSLVWSEWFTVESPLKRGLKEKVQKIWDHFCRSTLKIGLKVANEAPWQICGALPIKASRDFIKGLFCQLTIIRVLFILTYQPMSLRACNCKICLRCHEIVEPYHFIFLYNMCINIYIL